MVTTTVRSEIESLLASLEATDDEVAEAGKWLTRLEAHANQPEGIPTTPPETVRMGWR